MPLTPISQNQYIHALHSVLRERPYPLRIFVVPYIPIIPELVVGTFLDHNHFFVTFVLRVNKGGLLEAGSERLELELRTL
eukprot:g63006.t1